MTYGRRRTAALCVYATLAGLVLWPIVSVPVPSLGDYLNHLARIHILTAVDHSAALQRFYDRRWQIVPYYGMDLPVALLARFMNLYVAGRVFVAACILMPVAAAAALRLALFGRIGMMPVLAYLLCYNYVLALGFLNYLFCAGLAVMLFAAWIYTRPWPRWPRAAAFVAPVTILYFGHSFAFIAYGLLVASFELGQAAACWPDLRTIMKNTIAAGLQAVPPLLLTIVLRVNDTFGSVHVTRYGSVGERIGAMLSPLYFPGGPVWMPALFVAAPVLGLVLAGGPRLPRLMWPVLAALAIGALAAPQMLLNIWGVDFRLPLVLAIVLVGAASPGPARWHGRTALVVAAVAALVGLRAATAHSLLAALNQQITQIRQVVALLPAGMRVLVVDDPQNAPARLAPRAIIQHMGMVAVIDRDAFLPSLFAGTTPLRLLPSLQNAASQAVIPLSLADLNASFSLPDPVGAVPPYRDGAQMYWLGWRHKFDYVLLTHFGGTVGALPPVLHQVAGNTIANLYRIDAR